MEIKTKSPLLDEKVEEQVERRKQMLIERGRKISLAKIGKPRALATEETKRKMSETHKRIGTGKWMKDRNLSKETKEKISKNSAKYWLGKSNPHAKNLPQKFIKGQVPWNKNLKGFLSGEKHYNYQGGITPTNFRIRTSVEYKQWREAVFKWDNYTCVLCGSSESGTLNADHYPIPFSAILNKLIIEQGLENLYEKALEYDLFWSLDNGRTLCEPCHKKTDTWGVKANKFKIQ